MSQSSHVIELQRLQSPPPFLNGPICKSLDLSLPVDVNDFIRQQLPPQVSFWGEGLLDPQSKLFIFGNSGLGKSLMAANLAISLALGRPYLDYRVPRALRVLYIQAENSEYKLQERLTKMLRVVGAPLPQGSFTQKTIKGLDIQEPEHYEAVRYWLQQLQPDVVIFDPLYQFHNGEENSAQEMKQVLGRFDALIDEFGISVVLIHHPPKPAKDAYKASPEMRGSVVFKNWADSVMRCYEVKDSRVRIAWVKLRNAPPQEALTIEKDTNFWFSMVKDDQTSLPTNNQVTTATVRTLMLSIRPAGEWIGQSHICRQGEACHLPATNVRRRLQSGQGKQFERRRLEGEDRRRLQTKDRIQWRVL